MRAGNRFGYRRTQGRARRSRRYDGRVVESSGGHSIHRRRRSGAGSARDVDGHRRRDACDTATRRARLPPIVAVAVTSQYMSVIPVAADGMPTGPCVLWMDTRGAEHNLSLLTDESFALFVERHGLIPLPTGNDDVGHIHVLRTFHPECLRGGSRVRRADGLRQCPAHRPSGRNAVDDVRAAGVRQPHVGHHRLRPRLVAATRLDPDKLAPLLPMNGIVGAVTSTAAAELGIAEGTPVTTGTIDSITSAIGAGALTARDGSIIVGTTSVMVTPHRPATAVTSVPACWPCPARWSASTS